VGVEERALDVSQSVGLADDLAQDADELLGHLARGLEALVRLGTRRLEEEAIEGLVLLEDVARRRVGEDVLVLALKVEARDQDGERAPDAVEIARGRGRPARLRRRVSLAPVDVAARVVGAADGAEIDE